MVQLEIARSVLEFIKGEAIGAPTEETGGILMGPASTNDRVVITHASGPGPAARRSATDFARDTRYCAEVLNEHFHQFGVDYVGEWHSHLGSPFGPSPGDFATLHGIMSDPDYDFAAFVMIIAVVTTRGHSLPVPTVELVGVKALRLERSVLRVVVAPILQASSSPLTSREVMGDKQV